MSDSWSVVCDIEVCFPGAEMKLVSGSFQVIPKNHGIEDRSERGWGPTIRLEEGWSGDRKKISDLVHSFIAPLHDSIARVSNHGFSPLVRVGVFVATMCFTVRLEPATASLLAQLGATIEFSVYPGDVVDA